MTRAAVLGIAALGFASSAAADSATPPEPDEIADVESREANLESIEPRAGFVLAASAGGGITFGGDIGSGRGPALSLRLGHVATRRTIITFEVTAIGALHKPAMTGKVLTDTNAGLLAGAQRYASASTWVRAAGGLGVFTANIGGDERTSGGIAALLGGGLDLARWGYLVLGAETFAMTSITGDGFKFQLALNVGLSYY